MMISRVDYKLVRLTNLKSVKDVVRKHMKIENRTPSDDGYYMPAEYAKHKGTIMIWPIRPGSWPFDGKAAKKVFTKIADIISENEEMYMLTDSKHLNEAKEMLSENVHVVEIESDDAWARDVGPTFVTNGTDVRGINWSFNAWGGEYDGLYANWEKDDKVAKEFMEKFGYDYYDASPFVLEGGSIHSDGEGTVIVTESCLLSKGRNPSFSKMQIEDKLKQYLGAEKIIWLPYGIYNDETNEHIDNVCAFTSPSNVVLAWTDDINDPQYEMSKKDLEVLENETDAKGRKISVHKLYIPQNKVVVKEEELAGYVFEEGEDFREAGERLAASYVNFYVANKVVLVPQFDDIMDEKAVKLLKTLFTDRKVIGIYARDIILGGGNIHCITQQIPQ